MAAGDENLPGDARGDDECRRFRFLYNDALPLPVLPEKPDHHAEYLRVGLGANHWISLVLRTQYDATFLATEAFGRDSSSAFHCRQGPGFARFDRIKAFEQLLRAHHDRNVDHLAVERE